MTYANQRMPWATWIYKEMAETSEQICSEVRWVPFRLLHLVKRLCVGILRITGCSIEKAADSLARPPRH